MHPLDATQTITSSSMFNAIKDLLEPIRFGEGVAIRLKDQSNDCEVTSLLTFDRADYKYVCLKLEEVVSKVMHQRDMWKDRFFFKALEADLYELCSSCKEDMRKTFYDKGDEEAALKWRPGKAEECVDTRKCKMYSWESYEEEYHEDYIRDIKVDEFVSDISSDEECNCPTCSLDSQ